MNLEFVEAVHEKEARAGSVPKEGSAAYGKEDNADSVAEERPAAPDGKEEVNASSVVAEEGLAVVIGKEDNADSVAEERPAAADGKEEVNASSVVAEEGLAAVIGKEDNAGSVCGEEDHDKFVSIEAQGTLRKLDNILKSFRDRTKLRE